MKKLKLVFTLFVSLGLFLSLFQVVSSQNNFTSIPLKDKFIVGLYTITGLNEFVYNNIQMSRYDSLFFNTIMVYCWHTDTGDIYTGGFYDDITIYSQRITDMLNVFSRSTNFGSNSTIQEREKLLRPAFGQQSIYQSEVSGMSQRPAYGFYNHRAGVDSTDGTVRGIYCDVVRHDSGYIVDSLIENMEQVNDIRLVTTNDNGKRVYSDLKDSTYLWFICPRMRIDTSITNDNSKLTDTVVRIEIYNFNGDSIISYIIIVGNFLHNGIYNGEYIENFWKLDNSPYPLSILSSKLVTGSTGNNITSSKVDYKVYWYGKVPVWLDYVKVEDEWSHYLFNPQLEGLNGKYKFAQKIQEEIQAFNNGNTSMAYSWGDEMFYNNAPCVKKVNDIIKQTNPNARLIGTFSSDWSLHSGLRYPPEYSDGFDYIVNNGFDNDFLIPTMYPFFADVKLPNNIRPVDVNEFPGTASYEYTTRDLYNESVSYMYTQGFAPWGLNAVYRRIAKLLKNPNYDITFYPATQIHSFESCINAGGRPLREPTMEEISLQCYLSMSWGAKGIMEYSYNSYSDSAKNYPGKRYYDWGMLYEDVSKTRDTNYYGQKKWDSLKVLNKKLRKLGDILYHPGDRQKHFLYKNTVSLNDQQDGFTLPYTYFNDISSFYNYQNPTWSDTSTLTKDPANKKYWEAGFFDDPVNQNKKYLMLVNKRCTPTLNGVNGDLRTVKLYFNQNSLSSFKNWELKDLLTGDKVVFNSANASSGIYFPYPFQPGEGKLFRLAPVAVVGGTFVCNEVLSTSFDCDSTVFNNGYNLTIHCGTNIDFKEKGKIFMNGGSFICSFIPDNSNPDPCAKVQLRGKNGGIWEGLSFDGCTSVNIENLEFSNVGYYNGGGDDPGWQNCAVSITNCFNFIVGDCIFNMNSSANGVNLFFNSFNDEFNWGNSYVCNCTFNVNQQSPTAVNVLSVASVNTPVKIENCKFLNNNSSSSPYAIFLNEVTGGVIQSNFIHKFSAGVYALSSSVDLFYNRIYSDRYSAYGLNGLSGSTLNMIPNLNYFTGGYNIITNTGEYSKNINVDNSYFDIDNGYNIFNLLYNHRNDSYHLYGIFNRELTSENPIPARLNCFQLDTVPVQSYSLEPVRDVKWSGNEAVEFNFLSYSCNGEFPDDYEVFSEEGMLNDTIYLLGGGNGGGNPNAQLPTSKTKLKNITNTLYDLPISAFDLIMAVGGKESEVQTYNYKAAYDSVCINLRKRNYPPVVERSKYLLTNYPDSIKSIDLVSKLYLASLLQDSSGNKIGPLKTYFEGLILNNPGNVSLIRQAFYYVQKCKVALKQYQSAMQGFYTIMQQNPYSYEGLVASWDYAATNILDSISGHSGGETEILQDEMKLFDLEILVDRTFSSLDSTRFTKQERKVITKNVSETMQSSKQKQVERVDALQKKSEKGDVKAKVELKQVKVLNEVIKPKKPVTVVQLKKIISTDINKVFKKDNAGDKTTKNVIPTEYNLSQNYPNPFNPVTKINYELPKDGKVKIVIYDILGREIKSLVNNEFKTAGRYTVEFNGTQYASGVYFYRIQVEGGKGYTAVKKMVLVK
jgi:hypothetical protein